MWKCEFVHKLLTNNQRKKIVMQIVKHAIEELSRFNPEARLEPILEFRGISPNTLCEVLGDNFEGREVLENEVEELEEKVRKLQDNMEEITAVLDGDDSDEEKLKEIQKLLA